MNALVSCRQDAKIAIAHCPALAGFSSLDFTVAWRRMGLQRAEQPGDAGFDLIQRSVECGLIGLRGLVKAADLADEL